MVSFVIPGDPQGKARTRVNTKAKKRGRVYTPSRTRNYESLVKREYREQVGAYRFGDDTPLYVAVRAMFAVPKSTSKAKRQKMLAGEIFPVKRPDSDNIFKIVTDALNGVAYGDDKQIVKHEVEKMYAEKPEVLVIIDERRRGNAGMSSNPAEIKTIKSYNGGDE